MNSLTPKSASAIWVMVFFVGVVGRLIPHLANFTPILSLCLFSAALFRPISAVLLMFTVMFISDVLLGHIAHQSIMGSWAWFTYSGLAVVTLLGRRHQISSWRQTGAMGGAACLVYWLWTNLGVFITSGLYPMTWGGFMGCYSAAIPFLGYSFMGTIVWLFVLFGFFKTYEKRHNQPLLIYPRRYHQNS